MQRLFLKSAIALGSIAAASLLANPERAIAAESVVLNYGIFSETISVAELRTLVDTGEPSPTLEYYLERAEQDPAVLQQALASPLNVDGTWLYRALNSPPGEFLLDRIGTIVRTPTGKANREALRAALVSSALEDGQLQLVEVMENYPTAEVYVEGDRLLEMQAQLQSVLERLAQFGFGASSDD